MTTIRTPRSPFLPALFLVLAALTAGCATAPAAAPPPAAEEGRVAEPAEAGTETSAATTVTCYHGPSRQILADGSERTGAELLLRHSFERSAGRIVEETVRFDPLPQVPARLYTTIYQVDGDSFTLEESEGQYAGSGMLEGEPWAWTGWSSDYTLESGIRVTAEYDFGSEDGRATLDVERQAFGPDGSAALTIVEELAEIGAEECEERLAQAVTDGG